jgi:hypothetical protein
MFNINKNLVLIALSVKTLQSVEFTLHNATALCVHYAKGNQVTELAPGRQISIIAENGDFIEITHDDSPDEVFRLSIERRLLHAICQSPYAYSNNSFKTSAFRDNKLCVTEEGFWLMPKNR